MTKTTGTNYFTKYTSTVDVALTDLAGQAALIQCTASNLPTDAGYKVGCIAIATDTGNIYHNVGTTSVASFSLFTTSSITLATALTDAATTTGTSLSATYSAITTGIGISSINGNTTNFTTGATLFKADLDVAIAGQGLSIVGTGAYTGTGLALITNNALTTGKALSISTTGLTTGHAINVLGGTAMTTGGVLAYLDMGAATAGNGATIITTGIYAGTGLLSLSATAATTGTMILVASAEAGLTSGKYMNLGTVFTVSKYGATVIAGNASGTAALTLTAGDIVLTSGRLILTANSSVISCTGTGTNGMLITNPYNDTASALSGTQRDIKIMIGATPYYFTVYPVKA